LATFKIPIVATPCLNVKNVMLSERNQPQKKHTHLCEMFRIDKSINTQNRLMGSRSWERGEEGK
jgi:hypothetical protein